MTDYTTRAELKARLNIPSGNTSQDSMLDAIITSASRAVDNYCRRSFSVDSSAVRYFVAEDGFHDLIEVDDLLSVSSIVTDDDGDGTYETTWATTDYVLEPYNAARWSQPYTKIRVNPSTGRYAFPATVKGVKITGNWGYWTSVPEVIEEATIRWAERLYKLKDAPLGIVQGLDAGAGGNAVSMMRVQMDHDIKLLLAPYRLEWVVV